MDLTYDNAKEKLLTSVNVDCQQFFLLHGYRLEYGYSKLLEEDLDAALKAFKDGDNDVRAQWASILISFIKCNIQEYPTYFQLRNFLEIDLNILIHYGKGNYVENIVRYADFMYSINPEVYKFIGRVFYSNNLYEHAMFFLNLAKNYFYNDPELHYLLSYINYNRKDYHSAEKSANDCLSVLPNYYPAIDMLSKVRKILY